MAWGDKGGWQGDGGGPWGSGGSGGGSGGNRPPGSGGPKGPQQTPPDLDELLKKAQDRARNIFTGGGNNNGSAKRGLMWAGGGIVVLLLFSCFYVVKADEEGVVTRFGKFHRTTAPGMNVRLPYPIEAVKTPKVTVVNRTEIGFRAGSFRSNKGDSSVGEESLMLTGDENIIDVNFEVQWKISNAPDFLFNVREPEATVKAIAESAMREVIGKASISTVLAEGKLEVEQATKKLIQDTLENYKAGVEVVSVNLLKADPPNQVIASYRDVQSAKADKETEMNKAETYRNDILPRARGEAEQLIQDAEAYKQEVVARAQGEAARFTSVYNQFKLSKDVTRKRMYLETMEEILPGMNKVIIDGKSGANVVPYLPLNELKPKAEN